MKKNGNRSSADSSLKVDESGKKSEKVMVPFFESDESTVSISLKPPRSSQSRRSRFSKGHSDPHPPRNSRFPGRKDSSKPPSTKEVGLNGEPSRVAPNDASRGSWPLPKSRERPRFNGALGGSNGSGFNAHDANIGASHGNTSNNTGGKLYSSSVGSFKGTHGVDTDNTSGNFNNTNSGNLSRTNGGNFNNSGANFNNVSGGQLNNAHGGNLSRTNGGNFNNSGANFNNVSGANFNNVSGGQLNNAHGGNLSRTSGSNVNGAHVFASSNVVVPETRIAYIDRNNVGNIRPLAELYDKNGFRAPPEAPGDVVHKIKREFKPSLNCELDPIGRQSTFVDALIRNSNSFEDVVVDDSHRFDRSGKSQELKSVLTKMGILDKTHSQKDDSSFPELEKDLGNRYVFPKYMTSPDPSSIPIPGSL